ncbi:hypothetical protein EON62_03400, partial [archaeon]
PPRSPHFLQAVLNPRSEAGSKAAAKKLPSEPVLEPNPFVEDDLPEGMEPAAMAYRYRRWKLSEDISVVARTTVNAIARRGTTPTYVSLCTLNEWDSKVAGTSEWRQIVDTQRGNLLGTELKNNGCKMAKATLGAILADTSCMRLGLISRVNRADPTNHALLAVHDFEPRGLASQLNLSVQNGWAIIRWLVDTVREHAKNLEEVSGVSSAEYSATFVLLRHPTKQQVVLYNVPNDAFDEANESTFRTRARPSHSLVVLTRDSSTVLCAA